MNYLIKRSKEEASRISFMTNETILGLDKVSFYAKAIAMGGNPANEIPRAIKQIGNEDAELDLKEIIDWTPDTEPRCILTDRWAIIGGLCHDDTADDPTESMDGEGSFKFRGRRGSREDEAAINDALGLDREGCRDYSLDGVVDVAVQRAIAKICGDRSLMTSLSNLIRGRTVAGNKDGDGSYKRVFSLVKAAAEQEGLEFAADYIATYFLQVPYLHEVADEWRDKIAPLTDCFSESEMDIAWETALDEGLIGNPMAVQMDVYEHSGISLSISGEGMQCRWDTSRGGAIWIPDSMAEDQIRSEAEKAVGFSASGDLSNECRKALCNQIQVEAEKYARSCIGTYNSYLNGDIHYTKVSVVCLETGEVIPDHDTSTSQIYGYQSAIEALEMEMLAKLDELNPQMQ